MRLVNTAATSTRLIVAAAVILLAAFSPNMAAQTNEAAPPANATLNGRKLINTVFETNSTGVSNSCADNGCTAVKALLPTASLTCPGVIGKTCTFSLQIESTTQISDVDQGLYRVLVDGVVPTPGPLAGGFYKFTESDPNSSDTSSHSALIVSTVKNTAANQVHHATVAFGCKDITGDGCFAFAALSSLRVDVFQP